jgi:hypothetical protein
MTIIYNRTTGQFEDSIPNNEQHWTDWLAAGNTPERGSMLEIYLERVGLVPPFCVKLTDAERQAIQTDVRGFWKKWAAEHPESFHPTPELSTFIETA